jgi:hypothetical protein
MTKQPYSQRKEKPWSKDEINYLYDNISVVDIKEMAKHLDRTENCINIKIHRLRLSVKKGGLNRENVSRNIVIEMLRQRIGNPNSFCYTPEFRENTGIGQKRFWQLYRGEKNLEQHEYVALCREWNMSLEDAFQLRQLKMDL